MMNKPRFSKIWAQEGKPSQALQDAKQDEELPEKLHKLSQRLRKMDKLQQMIANKGYVLADGAIGTNLFAKGLMTGDAPELWNLEAVDKIAELHSEFAAAGSDLLLTNSFGGTPYRMKLHNAENQVDVLNKAAAQIARKVADSADREMIVAGSMGPTGELFIPLGSLDEAGAVAAFTAQAHALADGGADVLWIETMSSLEEYEAAMKGAKTTGLPVYGTMTFDTAGRTMMGIQPGDFASFAVGLGMDGFGANCGIGPAELLDSVFGFTEAEPAAKGIIAKGNCGIPAYVDGKIHYHGTPELMADYALVAYHAGAQIIGGCCGTTAKHIEAMHRALSTVGPRQPISRDEAAKIVGAPWANVPVAPTKNGAGNGSGNGSDTGRRRRRRRE